MNQQFGIKKYPVTFHTSDKVEAKKAELGITNYGMDNGHTYPIKVKDKDGVDVVVAYERDIKLTRSI